jgi:hypothetical protein
MSACGVPRLARAIDSVSVSEPLCIPFDRIGYCSPVDTRDLTANPYDQERLQLFYN